MDRERVAARCGELMSAFHATPTQGLEAIAVNWPAFVERQRHECLAGILRAGLDARWACEVRQFFARLPSPFEAEFRPVLLNSDVTDEHVLVSRRGKRWEVTGIIDFGDCMLGDPHYDFAAPGCSITRGSPQLQRAMLLAYGFAEGQLDANLADRLMVYTLLHRFIGVPELLEMLHLPEPAGLADVTTALWSF